jgi:hypothetical protein
MTFLLYLSTLAPGVVGFDSAELVTGVHTLGIVHPTGYPTYLILGKLFSYLPVGNSAYRLNLMSAFFAALTVTFLYLSIQAFTKNKIVAWTGSALFAVSNYFWQMALVAEVYTLHTFFLALNLYLVARYRESGSWKFLNMFAFVFGLSMTNHVSSLTFAPGFAWLIITSPHWEWRYLKNVIHLAFLSFLGLLPYLYLPLRASAEPALNYAQTYYNIDLTTIEGFWWMISGKAYRFYSFAYSMGQLPGEINRFLGFLWRNFFGIGVLIGMLGLIYLWKRYRNILLGLLAIFLINAFFFINYAVMDKDTMFLPAYLIWAIFSAFGILGVKTWLEDWAYQHEMPRLIHVGFVVLMFISVFPAAFLNINWLDMSNETTSADFAQEVLVNASPDATIFAPWSPAVVLEYYQLVEGQRPDLSIINRSRYNVANYYEWNKFGLSRSEIIRIIQRSELEIVKNEVAVRPVYITEYDPLIASSFDYIPEGNYFKLVSRENN